MLYSFTIAACASTALETRGPADPNAHTAGVEPTTTVFEPGFDPFERYQHEAAP